MTREIPVQIVLDIPKEKPKIIHGDSSQGPEIVGVGPGRIRVPVGPGGSGGGLEKGLVPKRGPQASIRVGTVE